MIIVRYLIKETVKSQFAIFFVLFLVFLSQQFIKVLASASAGEIPASMIIKMVALNMPDMGLLMLPLSLYIGILITFGRLYAESEITVMNATGIGNKFLVRAALYLALITSVVAAFNAWWLAPWSMEQKTQLRDEIASQSTVSLLQQGSFQTTPDRSSVIFIDSIENKQLNNVFVAQLRPTQSLLPSVMYAKYGEVKELSDGRQIISLYKGNRYEGIPTRVDYMLTEFERYDGLIGQKDVSARQRTFEAMPTLKLWQESAPKAQAELQWRMSIVFCIPLLTMLVVPLSSVNPRQGRFAKMGPAILIYFSYFMVMSAAKTGIEEGDIPANIGLWPINAMLLITAISINWMDSITVRRLKDKFRQRKVAKRV